MIDTTVSTPDGFVDRGVVMGEGDGTVPILSTGYMCNRGWKIKRFNPAGIKIKVVEMPHEPDNFSPRGGPNTGDHVDILGRSSLNDLILRVAGGRGELVEERVVSDIVAYSAKVRIYEEEDESAGDGVVDGLKAYAAKIGIAGDEAEGVVESDDGDADGIVDGLKAHATKAGNSSQVDEGNTEVDNASEEGVVEGLKAYAAKVGIVKSEEEDEGGAGGNDDGGDGVLESLRGYAAKVGIMEEAGNGVEAVVNNEGEGEL